MATQKNFAIKNGLTVAGTERISASGDITGSHFGTFSGTSTTRAAGTNNTQLATTAFVTGAISDLVDSAPGTLNTLNELAAALNDDASFSTTITNSIATKAPLASPVFTGNAIVNDTLGVGTSDLKSWAAFDGRIRAGARGVYATTSASTQMGYNWYYDGAYKYIAADTANRYYQNGGNHIWESASSGSANGAITWSEKMRIDSNGNVGIGKDNPGAVRLYSKATASGNLAGLFENTHASGSYGLKIQAGSSASNYGFVVTNKDNANPTQFYVRGDGNIGIGTNSPSAKLDVTAGSGASTVVKFGSHYDTTLQMQATATASSSIQYLNAAGTSVVAMGYRDAGSGTDGAWRVRHAATLDTAGPYLNMATSGAVSVSTDTSQAPVVNSHAQLELITTTNANPAHSVLAFASGVGRLGAIEAQQRAGGSAPYGHISTIVNNGGSGSGAMVRAITANYNGKVGVGKGHNITPDMNLEVYAYNETSQWTSSGSYHGGTQAFAILSNSPPGPVAGDYGYYKDFWYYMNGNTSHTMIWDNSDSYFNAEVQIVAACTNGGTNNNVYARGFWTNNHTSHRFAVIEGMAQTSSNVGTVLHNTTGSIGGLANGNTFVFTASQGTNASNSGKLTLVHSYPGASFYGAKIRLRVYFGQFNGHSSTS